MGDLTTTAFKRTTTIIDIKPTSNVYWIEESQEGYYQILFGDDILGKRPPNKSSIKITYIVTNLLSKVN